MPSLVLEPVQRLLGPGLDVDVEQESPAPVAPYPDPFRGAAVFDNGAAICDLIVHLYYLHPADPIARWPDPTSTRVPDSYFAWLNARCDEDPAKNEPRLAVTNLANAIHQARPDLRAAFGNLFGADRLGFVNWHLTFARTEYGLDAAFFAPVFESVARGARGSDERVQRLNT